MGLLDDAIREHLDLKRRRGADPAEVARLEQEALGPVRREPVPAEPAADEHREHAPEPAVEHPHPADEGRHPDDRTHVLAPEDRREPPHGDALFEHHDELGGAAAPSPEPAAAREPEPEDEDHSHSDEPHAHEPDDPRRSEIVHQPTTEFRVEDHHDDEDGHAAQPADEDVLEETPDFLQETPEHDRLWFEQRPPRDFDFDG